jgi:ATP-dependent Clp protease, protease subunit
VRKNPKSNRELLRAGSVIASERELLREIRIVGLTEEIDFESATDFIQDLTLLTHTSSDPITVIIASNGGDVEAGLACIRSIKQAQQRGIKVIGQVYGHAMSMAFLILQCCDERVMGKGCILMAHGITSFRHGDMRNLESERKLLHFWRGYFAKLLASRCSKGGDGEEQTNPEHWIKVLEDQTPQYYESDECLNLGLIDRVEEPEKAQQ